MEERQERRGNDEEEQGLVIGIRKSNISDDGEDEAGCTEGGIGGANEGSMTMLGQGRNGSTRDDSRQIVLRTHQGISSL